MILSRFLIVGVLAMLIVGGTRDPLFGQLETLAANPVAEAENEQELKAVSLLIDFGDGFEKRYTQLDWNENLTVVEAMEAAKSHRRALKYKVRGKGETAFLLSIDGQENEGGAGSNWIYYINGERADRGFGAKVVEAGDTILWSFEK